MQNFDIALVAVVWLAGSVLLLPLLAVAARVGLVPLVRAVADARRARTHAAVEQRLAAIELALAEIASRDGTSRTPAS